MALKRIQTDLLEVLNNPPNGCKAAPDGQDLFHWGGTIVGPPKTPYEGGIFSIEIMFPPDYPFKAPRVTFKTRVFHPNVGLKGILCLPILKEKWTYTTTVSDILVALCDLLSHPNFEDPLIPAVAKIYENDPADFEKKARESTRRHAI